MYIMMAAQPVRIYEPTKSRQRMNLIRRLFRRRQKRTRSAEPPPIRPPLPNCHSLPSSSSIPRVSFSHSVRQNGEEPHYRKHDTATERRKQHDTAKATERRKQLETVTERQHDNRSHSAVQTTHSPEEQQQLSASSAEQLNQLYLLVKQLLLQQEELSSDNTDEVIPDDRVPKRFLKHNNNPTEPAAFSGSLGNLASPALPKLSHHALRRHRRSLVRAHGRTWEDSEDVESSILSLENQRFLRECELRERTAEGSRRSSDTSHKGKESAAELPLVAQLQPVRPCSGEITAEHGTPFTEQAKRKESHTQTPRWIAFEDEMACVDESKYGPNYRRLSRQLSRDFDDRVRSNSVHFYKLSFDAQAFGTAPASMTPPVERKGSATQSLGRNDSPRRPPLPTKWGNQPDKPERPKEQFSPNCDTKPDTTTPLIGSPDEAQHTSTCVHTDLGKMIEILQKARSGLRDLQLTTDQTVPSLSLNSRLSIESVAVTRKELTADLARLIRSVSLRLKQLDSADELKMRMDAYRAVCAGSDQRLDEESVPVSQPDEPSMFDGPELASLRSANSVLDLTWNAKLDSIITEVQSISERLKTLENPD